MDWKRERKGGKEGPGGESEGSRRLKRRVRERVVREGGIGEDIERIWRGERGQRTSNWSRARGSESAKRRETSRAAAEPLCATKSSREEAIRIWTLFTALSLSLSLANALLSIYALSLPMLFLSLSLSLLSLALSRTKPLCYSLVALVVPLQDEDSALEPPQADWEPQRGGELSRLQ